MVNRPRLIVSSLSNQEIDIRDINTDVYDPHTALDRKPSGFFLVDELNKLLLGPILLS
jgi:hypothetical protein